MAQPVPSPPPHGDNNDRHLRHTISIQEGAAGSNTKETPSVNFVSLCSVVSSSITTLSHHHMRAPTMLLSPLAIPVTFYVHTHSITATAPPSSEECLSTGREPTTLPRVW